MWAVLQLDTTRLTTAAWIKHILGWVDNFATPALVLDLLLLVEATAVRAPPVPVLVRGGALLGPVVDARDMVHSVTELTIPCP